MVLDAKASASPSETLMDDALQPHSAGVVPGRHRV